LIAWFNLVYGLYISDLYLFITFYTKVYLNIIKGNMLSDNIKTTSYNKYFIYCKFAHHYETSIRVSCVQQYVENILIIIYIWYIYEE
jgi:hypothetical protein